MTQIPAALSEIKSGAMWAGKYYTAILKMHGIRVYRMYFDHNNVLTFKISTMHLLKARRLFKRYSVNIPKP